MKKILASISLIILGSVVLAQTYDQKFGKVSLAEMEMKVCSIDSSAEAVMLFDVGETKMVYNDTYKGFQLDFTRHFRMKILKKDGFENGNIEILLYQSGGDVEKLTNFKGVTFNLVNGEIVKSKVERENKFKDNYNSNYVIYKIAFPKVEVGSIIECEYSILSDFPFNFKSWDFQMGIPVLFSKYDTYMIDYYSYNSHLSGYEKVDVQTPDPYYRSFKHTWDEYDNRTAKKTSYYKVYEYKEVKKSFTAHNLPALKNESYVDDIDNYRTRIEFELAYVRIPNQMERDYSSSWDAISKKLIDNDEFGKQLSNSGYMKDELASVINGISSPEEKISKILSFISNKIKWNEINGIYTDKGVKTAFKEGEGNVADINLNLVIALRNAGLEAFPIILSTRSHGRVFDWKKQVSSFNYVVAGIKLNDKIILSDATNKKNLGMLPLKCLNGQARIIDANNSNWIDINPKNISKKNGYAIFNLDNDFKLSGKVAVTYKDYFSLLFRESITGDDSLKNKKNELLKLLNNGSIDSIKVSVGESKVPEVKENYIVKNDESPVIAGDLIYLTPSVTFGMRSNPFVKDDRKYPVNFHFPFEESYVVKITIPDGYKVEELPASISFSLPENSGKFVFSCQNVGQEIVVINRFSISKIEFVSTEYPALKTFFDEAIKKVKEKVVLKKI